MKSARCAPYNHGVSLTKIDLHVVMAGSRMYRHHVRLSENRRPVFASPRSKSSRGRQPIFETRLRVSTLRQDSEAPPIRADCSDEHGRSADPRAVVAQPSKQRPVLRRGGDEDLPDACEHQDGSQARDHRLAEGRQELLGRHAGDGGEQGTCSLRAGNLPSIMDGTALPRQHLCAIRNQMLRDRDMICFEITT